MANFCGFAFLVILCKLSVLYGAPQNANSGVAVASSGGFARPMIAPMPPNGGGGGGMMCDDGATGFINDTCKADTDCYDQYMMTCVNKRCQCAKNFVEDPSLPRGSKQRTCSGLPSLFSSCTDVCMKPYECKSGNPDGMMPPDMMMPPPGGTGKSCQCPGKSRYVNGYCDAGCKSTQRVGNGGECVAKCTKDQILIDNECKSLADLGEKCAETSQCKAAFSSCDSGKCACLSGFTPQGSKCLPKTYSCPFGDPLKKGDSVVLCDGSQGGFPVCNGNGPCPMAAAAGGANGNAGPAPPPMPGKATANTNAAGSGVSSSMMPFRPPYKTDNCPNTHYCNNYDMSGMQSRGHCCPKPPSKCPVGDPHPTAKCNGGTAAAACPYNSHICLNVGGDYSSQVCCPKPCNGYDRVYAKDQCLPYVQYGDGCQANEQCQQHNGICQSGKCTCAAKATATDMGGNNKYCQLNCDSDEIQMGNECKPRLKLGDSCTADNSFCPSGAYCNNKGVCACICGFQKLNDKFCAPPPSCPSGPFGGSTSNADTKKATYCKLSGGGKPPVSASDKCPSKSFCSYYVENMGICCPIPEPYCPDGSKPTSKSNCHNGGVCGTNEMCNVYYYSAVTDSNGMPQQGSVCCPMNVPMQKPPMMGGPMPIAASAVASGPVGK